MRGRLERDAKREKKRCVCDKNTRWRKRERVTTVARSKFMG